MTAREAGRGARLRSPLFVALVCAALVFGLTLSHVLQDPGSRGLGGADWLQVQHTFYGGFAVVGGVAEIVGVVASAIAAGLLLAQRSVADGIRAGIAALCLLGTLAAYFFGNRPVNMLVAHWTPATLPADWTAYRNAWEAAHAISTVLSAAAFVLLAITAVWGSRPGAADTEQATRP